MVLFLQRANLRTKYVKVLHYLHTSFPHVFIFTMQKFIQSSIHYSVLWQESADLLNIKESKKHIDATLGMGGHVEYFFTLNPNLYVFGFDQDENARKIASERLDTLIKKKQLQIIPENFRKIEEICEKNKFTPTSILFDIGVSSLQFDDGDRGFSFRFKAPLDMRMNQSDTLTAKEIINNWTQEEIQNIFYIYGEEKHSYLITKKIVERREIQPFETTTELADFIVSIKPFSKKTLHPAALVFQALRIAVNKELEVLETAIHQAVKILEKGGRLAIITFHSLEDRIVKNVLDQYISKEKINKYKHNSTTEVAPINPKLCLKKISKKPIIPSKKEQEENPRSRSAKMRVVEKI